VYFIKKIIWFDLYWFLIRQDSILSCYMVMLHCTPPIGHVVTFHFHSFRENREKCIHCINKTKPHNCTKTWKNYEGKNKYCK